MAKNKKTGGVSLAKGPVALIGVALLAYGSRGSSSAATPSPCTPSAGP
jgi:hypothetical protein